MSKEIPECEGCRKRDKRIEQLELLLMNMSKSADDLIAEIEETPSRFVQCGYCWRTLMTKIPGGVTGDFYCSESCHDAAKGISAEIS